jgi:hypothetical protein
MSLAREAAAKAIAAEPNELNDLWILARALAIIGDREGAIRTVSKSLRRGDFSYGDLGRYPELASLRSDPRLHQVK